MSYQPEGWREDAVAVAEGWSSDSPLALLNDTRGPGLGVRWGSQFEAWQLVDFCAALADELRTSPIDSAGNDAMIAEQLRSLQALVGRLSKLDPELQGKRGFNVRGVLAALHEVAPYLDATFDELNTRAAGIDPALTA